MRAAVAVLLAAAHLVAPAAAAIDPSEPPKLMRLFFAALRDHTIDELHDNLTTTDFHIFEVG